MNSKTNVCSFSYDHKVAILDFKMAIMICTDNHMDTGNLCPRTKVEGATDVQ